MVIEIKDENIEKYLKNFSYKELQELIVTSLKEKLEDIRDYNMLKDTRNDEKIDFEKFINEDNN